jgi:hypothetical protein
MRSSGMAMTFAWISLAALIAFSSLSTRAAYATECVVSGPRYGLTSDTVDWSMKIGSGQSCIRGLRFNNMAIERVRLVSPPQTGHVTLLGPGFTYAAKSDYEGRDAFAVAVSGTINRVRGSSTIRITVSIGSPTSAPTILHHQEPGPITTPDSQSVSPVDNNLPLPAGGALPPCPTWDWSNGAPPPMRPPFDRSKLYCPPPPFKPPSQPIGCTCP